MYLLRMAIVLGILRGYINIWGYHIKSLIKIGNHILQYEWPEYYMYLNVFKSIINILFYKLYLYCKVLFVNAVIIIYEN